PRLQSDNTDPGGIYEVGRWDNRTALHYAAQQDANESALDELASEQKKLLSTLAHVVEWSPSASLKDQVAQSRSGAEFWLPIIIIAMLVAGAETFLAQWFSRAK